MSGKKLIAGFLAGVTLLASTACGAPAAEKAFGAGLPPAGDTIQFAEAQPAKVGAPVTTEGAKVLQLTHDQPVQPVAEWDDRILLTTRGGTTAVDASVRISAWDPETGGASDLWESAKGTQDVITAVDGDWATVVRTGHQLPFGDWELQLRNLRTDEVRTLAKADPAVAGIEGLEPGPPLGFAPYPSIHDGKVVWAQYRAEGGEGLRDVVLYDLATSQTSVLRTGDVDDVRIDSPSIGGNRVAWVESAPEGEDAQFVIHELTDGSERRVDIEGLPFVAALSADGRYLAWDHQMAAKFSYDIDGDKLLRFGTDEGWGVFAAGDRVAWVPAAAYGGTGGFLDQSTGTLRVIPRRDGVTTNVALVLPNWFAWQESTATGSAYYFLPLEQQSNDTP